MSKIYNKIILTTIFLATVFLPTPVAAQVNTIPDNTVPQVAAENNFDTSDLLWLIPLLAIPILAYYIFARRNNDDMGQKEAYYGVKGGRSTRNEGTDQNEDTK